MVEVEEIKKKYPGADAWQMGDSPELANELAELIKFIPEAEAKKMQDRSRKFADKEIRRKTYQAQHLGNRLADGPGWNTDHSLGKSHIFKYRPVL